MYEYLFIYVRACMYITPTKGIENNGTLNDSLNILAIGMYMYIYMYIYMCMYLYTYTYICIYMYAYMYILPLPKAWRIMARLMIV
jgi:hypothetical protein